MGVEWVCFGRGHFVPEILQKKLAPTRVDFTSQHRMCTYGVRKSRTTVAPV